MSLRPVLVPDPDQKTLFAGDHLNYFAITFDLVLYVKYLPIFKVYISYLQFTVKESLVSNYLR